MNAWHGQDWPQSKCDRQRYTLPGGKSWTPCRTAYLLPTRGAMDISKRIRFHFIRKRSRPDNSFRDLSGFFIDQEMIVAVVITIF